MKRLIALTTALAATAFASLANATLYTYTLDDMTYVDNYQAADQETDSNYWEQRATDRWGMVWTTPWDFSTTVPSATYYPHFHIGYKDPHNCTTINEAGAVPGNKVGTGPCVPLDPAVHRGPFNAHWMDGPLYFQLVKDDYTTLPFVVKNVDVYNSADQSINLYVRKTDGGWFYWGPLHGYSTGSPSYFRWILTSGYTGKFTCMAFISASVNQREIGAVGRVQITD